MHVTLFAWKKEFFFSWLGIGEFRFLLNKIIYLISDNWCLRKTGISTGIRWKLGIFWRWKMKHSTFLYIERVIHEPDSSKVLLRWNEIRRDSLIRPIPLYFTIKKKKLEKVHTTLFHRLIHSFNLNAYQGKGRCEIRTELTSSTRCIWRHDHDYLWFTSAIW